MPVRLIGESVRLRTDDGRLLAIMTGAGQVVAEHVLVAPGEASVRDEHYGGPRPAPRRAVRPKTAAEKAFCALGPTAEAFITGAAAAGNTRLGPELAELNTLRAAHGEEAFAAALDRAVAFGRWRAADVRSILAAGPGTADPRAAGDALVLELPVVPVRPLSRLRHRRAVMTAAAPPLAADLTDGLRRLKLAAMRRLAPELLLTAKTQRWTPEELLRTLVEAEISARDASNARTRLKARRVPGDQDPGRVRPGRLLGPAGHRRLPGLAGMDHRRREPVPGRAGRHRQEPPAGRARRRRRRRPGTRSATSPPPSSPRPSTAAWPTTASAGSSTPCSATTSS